MVLLCLIKACISREGWIQTQGWYFETSKICRVGIWILDLLHLPLTPKKIAYHKVTAPSVIKILWKEAPAGYHQIFMKKKRKEHTKKITTLSICAHDMESGLHPRFYLPAGPLDEYGFVSDLSIGRVSEINAIKQVIIEA